MTQATEGQPRIVKVRDTCWVIEVHDDRPASNGIHERKDADCVCTPAEEE